MQLDREKHIWKTPLIRTNIYQRVITENNLKHAFSFSLTPSQLTKCYTDIAYPISPQVVRSMLYTPDIFQNCFEGVKPNNYLITSVGTI